MIRDPMIALFTLAMATAGLATTTAASPEIVQTSDGRVKGELRDGVLSWKGIPFAARPTGPLRWRAPQAVQPWNDIRPATQFSNDCMQLPFPSDAAPLGTPPSEDCLYLNVWKPEGKAQKLPVLVWIYGGGFVNGGASPPTYSGAEMARKGVIFVSFNYRVGRFGFFAHPALSASDADKGLGGNFGYLDQIAALKWVQRNIAKFGGDPAQVTIVGESAGGGSVHALVTSPLTDGLFDKAVVMSGGNGSGLSNISMEEAEKIGVAFAQSKGIPHDDPGALEKLRALSADDVVDGLNMTALFRSDDRPRTYSGPIIDGRIAVDGTTAYRSSAYHRVPMMIGATSGDMGGRDGIMVAGARDIERILADNGEQVYAYRFSYIAEKAPVQSAILGSSDGALHASDIPYFFNNQAIRYGDQTTPRDNAMGEIISTYLANFVKTGTPNGKDMPQWPTYDRTKDVIMDFTTHGTAVADKDPWTQSAAAAAAAKR